MRLERGTEIRRGERPVRRPLFAQVDADADIVKNALLVLEWPQGAAVQQACRDGLESSPTVETAVRLDRQLSQTERMHDRTSSQWWAAGDQRGQPIVRTMRKR